MEIAQPGGISQYCFLLMGLAKLLMFSTISPMIVLILEWGNDHVEPSLR